MENIKKGFMKKEIKTKRAQNAPGLLSQAIEANGLIFTADGKMVGSSTEEKLEQIMTNIEEVLEAAGSSLKNIIKVTIYVTDISILGDFNKKYITYFSDPFS